MLRAHVAERLAIAAGLAPADRPVRRLVSFGLAATVLVAVVGLVGLYLGVRALTAPDLSTATSAQEVSRIAPAAGPDRLMSIEDMERLAGQH